MTRRHVTVTPAHGTVGTRRRRRLRNLGVEDSGDPLPDWVFTQGVELVLDAEERMRTCVRGQEWRQDSDDLAHTHGDTGFLFGDGAPDRTRGGGTGRPNVPPWSFESLDFLS